MGHTHIIRYISLTSLWVSFFYNLTFVAILSSKQRLKNLELGYNSNQWG